MSSSRNHFMSTVADCYREPLLSCSEHPILWTVSALMIALLERSFRY